MQYISPEAIEGEVVDNRSDIYSLGCTAFHLLAGQPPFTGTSIASTMSAHLTKPVPSISQLNEHLPAKVDAVFERVLAKNPDDRYQSCAEFVTALTEAVGASEVRYPASAPTLAAATPPKKRAVDPNAPTQLRKGEAAAAQPARRRRAVLILASAVGVIAVAGAVLGVYANRGGSGSTPTADSSRSRSSMIAPSPAESPPLAVPPTSTTAAVTTAPGSSATTAVAAPPPVTMTPAPKANPDNWHSWECNSATREVCGNWTPAMVEFACRAVAGGADYTTELKNMLMSRYGLSDTDAFFLGKNAWYSVSSNGYINTGSMADGPHPLCNGVIP